MRTFQIVALSWLFGVMSIIIYLDAQAHFQVDVLHGWLHPKQPIKITVIRYRRTSDGWLEPFSASKFELDPNNYDIRLAHGPNYVEVVTVEFMNKVNFMDFATGD